MVRYSSITLLYIFCLFCHLNVEGQMAIDTIPCTLSNLTSLTLDKNPQLQRQKLRIARNRADLQIATSLFDYRLNASLNANRNQENLFTLDPRFPVIDGRIKTNNYTASGGIQRILRTSLSTRVGFDYARISDNFPLNQFNEEVGSFVSNNFTTINLSFNQPLLRGRGRKFATANEQFSKDMVESSIYDLIFLSSGELSNMALAYWQYLSSFQRLKVFIENEARIRKVLEITQDLVNAERKAESDLIQIQADLTDKERQTVIAQQQLYNSRQNLGRFIGLNEEESRFFSHPINPFPKIDQANYTPEISLEKLLLLARNNRADLKALIISKNALEILFEQSRNNLKPQLDLQSSISYGGIDVGNGLNRVFTPLEQEAGRNVQVGFGLNFLFPLNNNAAKAGFLRSKVAVEDQQVVIDNQIRNIELDISIALNELHNSVINLEKSYKTFQYYQEVFNNEQIKFQNGLTTLLNLILFQERLTFSQLDYLQAQQEFASAIINIRQETGTIFPLEEFLSSSIEINAQVFYELPTSN